jgi:hypothetical protein
MLVRMILVAAVLCAASSCKPPPVAGDQGAAGAPGAAAQGAAGGVELQFYDRRVAKAGEVPAPPVLLRLSGRLGEKNGCLIVATGTGDHALVFETGTATFDAAQRALRVGSANFPLGGPISVGGPFNQPAESFDRDAVKRRCGVRLVWLVTGADVSGNP